jgi:hypothetical protein
VSNDQLTTNVVGKITRFVEHTNDNTPSVPFYSAYRFLAFVSEYKVLA